MADGKRQPCRFKKSACQARSDLRHPVYCAAQPGTHGFHRSQNRQRKHSLPSLFSLQKNQPEDQRVCPIGDGYNLCVNPYPILPYHITIPSAEHREQILPADFCNTVSTLLNELPDEYALFYNGALCGASAPDHLHFQGVPTEHVPLIAFYRRTDSGKERLASISHSSVLHYIDSYVCPLFCIEQCRDGKKDESLFTNIMKELPCSNNEPEPKVNILAWQEDEKQIILIIPRCKHRPECYSAEAGKQMLVSPGTLIWQASLSHRAKKILKRYQPKTSDKFCKKSDCHAKMHRK